MCAMRESFHIPPPPHRGPLLSAIGKFFETPQEREDRERRERIKRLPNDVVREQKLKQFDEEVRKRKEKETRDSGKK